MTKDIDIIVPDASIIIEGILSKKIRDKEIIPQEMIIHEAVVSWIYSEAKDNKAAGFLGLEELRHLKNASSTGFKMSFAGKAILSSDIPHLTIEDLNSLSRDLAYESGGIVFTVDRIQEKICQIKGIFCRYLKVDLKNKKLILEQYFDLITMSVHLKEGIKPMAKKGQPGRWEYLEVSPEVLTSEKVQEIASEIMEAAKTRNDGFIEIERPGSTIVQLGLFRITITRPPFSDGWEITAVRPVKRLSLNDYGLNEKLMERITGKAEGILIAGAPGMGKSTFASALAELYSSKNKIVKTVEAPRDLVLPDCITQYSISKGNPEEIRDILLLSRPDYTIFDEMRNTEDFKLFADLRLSGVGMVGVIHATNPVDAIQRFLGRIELGVIPQIIDTVLFIKDGKVHKILSLNMTVKVPSGMTEADLARPVVVINDFETKKLEYEMYSYGEETVVVPVHGVEKQSPAAELAKRVIMEEFSKYSQKLKVDIISENKAMVFVPKAAMKTIIGPKGQNINQIETKLGISIDVRELGNEESSDEKRQINYNSRISKKHVIFLVGEEAINKDIDIFLDEDFLLTVKTGKNGEIKINSDNKIGKMIVEGINFGGRIKLVSKG